MNCVSRGEDKDIPRQTRPAIYSASGGVQSLLQTLGDYSDHSRLVGKRVNLSCRALHCLLGEHPSPARANLEDGLDMAPHTEKTLRPSASLIRCLFGSALKMPRELLAGKDAAILGLPSEHLVSSQEVVMVDALGEKNHKRSGENPSLLRAFVKPRGPAAATSSCPTVSYILHSWGIS
jgi:hypothetical protein